MKNIPEINHCIPNPRAYWCRFCKAHNTFEYYGEHHLCKACRGAAALDDDQKDRLRKLVSIYGDVDLDRVGLNS